ncbi:hypothetical protein SAMN04487948_12315 [Halogranum amylolyticum]|uniref:Uncharacterized protein n=1 Tax=Halogranum amylolyticum TaxID=660520 RepID=A0A1H8W4W1_9EURY|nr:hypothetical protein [Halogranum amylolyticum]SEP22487.1 hypothetical protein SAMN04487948_12315 [Halogranum amylolyticum]
MFSKQTERAQRLAELLQREIGDELRAVVYYSTDTELFQDSGTYELVYLRGDETVPTEQTELKTVMEATGMESLGRTIRHQHGDHDTLNFVVKNYDTVTETFFFLSACEGVAVSLEPSVFISKNPLMDDCLAALVL